MKPTTEKYYAIKIGIHHPYFMIGANSTPLLFNTRVEAERAMPKQPQTRAVLVKVTNAKQ